MFQEFELLDMFCILNIENSLLKVNQVVNSSLILLSDLRSSVPIISHYILNFKLA